MSEIRSSSRPLDTFGKAAVAIALGATGLVGVAMAQFPANPQPEDRIMIANRIRVPESATWGAVRMTFLPTQSAPQWPVDLKLLKVEPIGDLACMGEPIAVQNLFEVIVSPLDLSPLPVHAAHSHWVNTPPQDEIWLHWVFQDQVLLENGGTYLIAIEASRGDWVGLRVLPYAQEVHNSDETSLISFDGGMTWLCLDSAAIWAIIGKVLDPNCSPLLQVTVEPDA